MSFSSKSPLGHFTVYIGFADKKIFWNQKVQTLLVFGSYFDEYDLGLYIKCLISARFNLEI